MSARVRVLAAAFAAILAAGSAAHAQDAASSTRWSRYVLPGTGTSVDFPVDIFPERAGVSPEGTGRSFRSADGSATLMIYAVPRSGQTPRSYLARQLRFPRAALSYSRVTDDMLVVSGRREGRIFYSRCNFDRASTIHCLFLSYPQERKRAFDRLVMRMSVTLSR